MTLTGCTPEDPRYDMVRSAINTLLVERENDDVYMRFIYHGQPPLEEMGIVVLLRYSFVEENQVIQATFAYFSEELFYGGVEANDLYGYRSQYSQLSATKMNEEYGFTP